MALVAPSAAWADESTPTDGYLSSEDVSDSLQDVQRLDGDLIVESAPVDAEIATEVEVPDDPTRDVVVTAEDGSALSIGLPFADDAGAAVRQSDGTVVYPAHGSANVVVPTLMGAQMLTVIADAAAPSAYSYEVGLDAGQRLELVDGGAVVVNADGTTEHQVTAPWATDAEGREVPTHFEVAGNSPTQVVDHAGAGDVAHPVVADPIFIGYLVRRCLMGIGLNGPRIAQIASRGSFSAIFATGGWAAVRCVMGK